MLRRGGRERLLPIDADAELSEYDEADFEYEGVDADDVRHAPYPSPGGYAFRMAGTSRRIPAFQGECEEGWADQPEVMEIVAVAILIGYWIMINANWFWLRARFDSKLRLRMQDNIRCWVSSG